jgi:hypothetical protein
VEVTIEKVFDCEREKIWAVIGNPERVDWVPSASDCVFDGSIRRFRMEGAGQLAEKIVLRDESEMVLKYSVTDSPAVDHHLATISLSKHEGNKTRFSWAQEFEPAQLEPFIRKGMEDSLVQLDSVLDLS